MQFVEKRCVYNLIVHKDIFELIHSNNWPAMMEKYLDLEPGAYSAGQFPPRRSWTTAQPSRTPCKTTKMQGLAMLILSRPIVLITTKLTALLRIFRTVLELITHEIMKCALATASAATYMYVWTRWLRVLSRYRLLSECILRATTPSHGLMLKQIYLTVEHTNFLD